MHVAESDHCNMAVVRQEEQLGQANEQFDYKLSKAVCSMDIDQDRP